MFEEKTYENILADMLSNVPNAIDKREGSVVYNALAPAALELAKVYVELDNVLNEAFADTASRMYLVRRASERGLVPNAATYAILRGVFNTKIEIGTRFSGDNLNYIVTAEEETEDEYYHYRLRCETEGAIGNSYIGSLIPISTEIDGLTFAEIEEILIVGEDEEDTEDFRKRYFESITSQAFGGNIADYKERIGELQGVGHVKVFPVWNGGGTVKAAFTDSSGGVPTEELIEYVQEQTDPTKDGSGVGFAPIGHIVTIVGAEAAKIDVLVKCELTKGYNWEDALPFVENAIKEYFLELNATWGYDDDPETPLIVRRAQLETRIFALSVINDITDIRIKRNEDTEYSTTNLTLGALEIAGIGEVVNNEST